MQLRISSKSSWLNSKKSLQLFSCRCLSSGMSIHGTQCTLIPPAHSLIICYPSVNYHYLTFWSASTKFFDFLNIFLSRTWRGTLIGGHLHGSLFFVKTAERNYPPSGMKWQTPEEPKTSFKKFLSTWRFFSKQFDHSGVFKLRKLPASVDMMFFHERNINEFNKKMLYNLCL